MTSNIKLRSTALLASIIITLLMARTSLAGGCANKPIDFVSDICWECMFPMKLGGVTVADMNSSMGLADSQDDGIPNSVICTCPTLAYPFIRIGLTFSFWEPAHLLETVKTPYCFPVLGYQLSNPNPGRLQGSHQKNEGKINGTLFAQVHYYIFPAMQMVSSVINAKCGGSSSSGFDIAYMTEVDPMWNDEMSNLLVLPETLLFSNPYSIYACVADSIASQTAGLPLNPLFWCAGAQGPVYPMGGHVNMDSFIEGNFLLAEKFVYKMSRDYMICDPALDICGCVSMPIWVKTHYRYQLAKPMKGSTCYPVGKTGLLWDAGKNPPFAANGNANDNFLWTLFRKHECCVSYN